ncbi:MAG: cobalamin-independent methionine synthase II family protein [Defluviicoccus sp.]|nr:cobalamin-independent methionine synthase II family protein [Defluviicoccus sp.]MDE0276757.1 cobalamin-independent methionine synthase II family protein [Defluviicoccus sp.]
MKRSEDRILTTHVGSLIRPKAIQDILAARQNGVAVDEAYHLRVLTESVAGIVRRQAETGVDVVSDGEFGKSISWSQYVLERLDGFERRPVAADGADPFARGLDRERFPEFYAELDAHDRAQGRFDGGGGARYESVCVAPIAYTGQDALRRDIDNFRAALDAVDVAEGFLPVAAPASVIPDRRNEYYESDEALIFAIADAMRVEYRTISEAGLLVQIDDARAAVTYDRMVPPASMEAYRAWLRLHMEALNHALDGIPPERVRYHVCWGSWPGPHTSDVPIREIVDLILSVNAGAYVLEMANPRHEHEWAVWKDVKLPDGKVLIPGVISHATNVVEHPELVAERIVRLAEAVGRENVIGSTDCGFAQGPFHRRVHPTVQWAKLGALVEGARLASERLWN